MSMQQLKETMELLHKGGAVPFNVVEAVNDLLEENKHLRDKVADPALGYGDKWKALALKARSERDRLHDENQSLRRSLTSEAVKDAKYNAEIKRLQKELEEARNALHKISDCEWEESLDSQFNDVFTTRTINPAQIANEALATGQEGEGDQE